LLHYLLHIFILQLTMDDVSSERSIVFIKKWTTKTLWGSSEQSLTLCCYEALIIIIIIIIIIRIIKVYYHSTEHGSSMIRPIYSNKENWIQLYSKYLQTWIKKRKTNISEDSVRAVFMSDRKALLNENLWWFYRSWTI